MIHDTEKKDFANLDKSQFCGVANMTFGSALKDFVASIGGNSFNLDPLLEKYLLNSTTAEMTRTVECKGQVVRL